MLSLMDWPKAITLSGFYCTIHVSSMQSKHNSQYSVRRLIRSQIIESAAYCYKILLNLLCKTVYKTRRLIESFGYCYHFYAGPN
jgi:hypothetical protein